MTSYISQNLLCYLHILKRRVTYDASNDNKTIDDRFVSFEDTSNKKINAIDEKITAMQKQLDDIMKALGNLSKK